MKSRLRLRLTTLASALVLAAAAVGSALLPDSHDASAAAGGYNQVSVEGGTEFAYVVYRALDRDGFCNAAAFGAVSLHPVLTDAPNDRIPRESDGQPSPRHTVDFLIDAGDGIIIETSAGSGAPGRSATGIPTYSLLDRTRSGSTLKTFDPLAAGAVDECQAWVKIASASRQPVNVLVIVHADEGDIGFDRIINFGASSATSHTLTARWNLVTWEGADGAAPGDALAGDGAGSDISNRVSAVMGWDATRQTWAAYYPTGAGVPGANDLGALERGQAYWVALAGAGPVEWRMAAAE